MKFLVVDDFTTMRKVVRSLLGQLGYSDIVEAEHGLEAWHIIQNGGIDFVVTDWNMPEMQGIDLLKTIRASGDTRIRSLPVLMVTAENKREQILEAAHAGVNGYIVKPFNAEIMKEKLDNIFSRLGGAK